MIWDMGEGQREDLRNSQLSGMTTELVETIYIFSIYLGDRIFFLKRLLNSTSWDIKIDMKLENPGFRARMTRKLERKSYILNFEVSRFEMKMIKS